MLGYGVDENRSSRQSDSPVEIKEKGLQKKGSICVESKCSDSCLELAGADCLTRETLWFPKWALISEILA